MKKSQKTIIDLFHLHSIGVHRKRKLVRPLYVFGPDDRRTYRDISYPWGLVGKITTSEGKSGTGALVGPNLVVTASHMCPWSTSSGYWWMKFVPASYDGVSLFGSGFQSNVQTFLGYENTDNVVGYDWAILKLYVSLGSLLGYFGYSSYSNSWNNHPYWTLLGYPSAISSGSRPSYQTNNSVHDVDGDPHSGKELETYADMTPGNSGGPYFGWWGNDPRLVGVVSGQEEDYQFPFFKTKENVVAGGNGFASLIAYGRQIW